MCSQSVSVRYRLLGCGMYVACAGGVEWSHTWTIAGVEGDVDAGVRIVSSKSVSEVHPGAARGHGGCPNGGGKG